MKGSTKGWTALAVLLAAGACAKQEAPPAAAAEPEKPKMEAAADARLKAMSATLAAAQSFSFSTTARIERVNAKGEKVARESTSEFVVARPNRFWNKRVRDGAGGLGVYDGTTLSLQSDAEKVWSQVEMPPTLDEALDYAAEVYRFPMPVADLLYSDPYGSFVADDTAAKSGGKESINGVDCEKVIVKTPVVEADIWIEAGDRALPCKLDIIYTEQDQKPHATIVFSNWNLAPAVDDKLFAYSAPAGYNKIRMVAEMSAEEEQLVRVGAATPAPAEKSN